MNLLSRTAYLFKQALLSNLFFEESQRQHGSLLLLFPALGRRGKRRKNKKMRYQGDMHSELLSSWDKKAKPRDPAILILCLWERMQSQSNHIFFFSLLSVWSGEGDIICSYRCCYVSLYRQLSSGKLPMTTKKILIQLFFPL